MRLGVERILQPVADLRLQLPVIGLVELRRRKCPLRLPCPGHQIFNRGHNLLDLTMGKLDRGEDHLFGLLLRARLDHHDAVFVAHHHDVYRGRSALRIGRVHHKLAIHAAYTHRTNRGAKWNVGESYRRGCGVDADHIRVILFVSREDQRDQLRLIAESVGEQRTDRAVDLPRRQNLFFAGPALALDEASGNAPACVRVLAIIHCQRKEVDAFARVGRSHSRCQYNRFARAHQGCATGLLCHAAGLKDQPLAAGKLDGYFMLRRHIVLVSFCSLGKLVWDAQSRAWKIQTRTLPQLLRAARGALVLYSVSDGDRDQCPVWAASGSTSTF